MSRDYISNFTGQEIDAAIQKAKDITKTAGEVNNALDNADKIVSEINVIPANEVVSHDGNGSLKGTGIIDEGNKIFFQKDARFPSGSIDVGASVTLSESAGWLRIVDQSTGDKFFALDYKNTEQGTNRPIYYEHGQQTSITIQPDNSKTISDFKTMDYTPPELSQVNNFYLDFATAVNNLRIEVISLVTNKTIKYIPNEKVWKAQKGGLNFSTGIQNIFTGETFTPMLFETTTPLRINMVADNQINLRGNGVMPYIRVDRQIVIPKGVLLQGEGTGSSDSPEQIRDKLKTLTTGNKLNINDIDLMGNEILNNNIQVLATMPTVFTNYKNQLFIVSDNLYYSDGSIARSLLTLMDGTVTDSKLSSSLLAKVNRMGSSYDLTDTGNPNVVWDVANKAYVITHNFNTQSVAVVVRDSLQRYRQVTIVNEANTVNTVMIYFNSKPTNSQYKVSVAPMVF